MSMPNALLMNCWRHPTIQNRQCYFYNKQQLHYAWRFKHPCPSINIVKFSGRFKLHPFIKSHPDSYPNIKQLLSHSFRPINKQQPCSLCHSRHNYLNAILSCYSRHKEFISPFASHCLPCSPRNPDSNQLQKSAFIQDILEKDPHMSLMLLCIHKILAWVQSSLTLTTAFQVDLKPNF